MRTRPILSIIIPLYNTEKYIAQCLRSILEDDILENGAMEVIVIDDGSTDASGDIVRSLQEDFRQIKYHRQPNQGVSSARSFGAQAAEGDFLWFIDSDDYLVPGAVRRIVDLIQSDPGLDLIAIPLLVQYDNGHHYVTPTYPAIEYDFVTPGKELLKRGFRIICPQQFILRKSLFFKEGVFFPKGIRYEDEYFSRVVQYYAAHTQALKDYLYVYRQWPGSFMNSAQVESVNYLVAVYKQLSTFAAEHVSAEDQNWFKRNIVSFLLETHTRFLEQVDSDAFRLFRKQYLPFIKQEFNACKSFFPKKERFLASVLLDHPRFYSAVFTRYNTVKTWFRR